MADVTAFDSRLRVETISREGLSFYDVKNPPFSVHGVMFEDDRFRRMPRKAALAVSEAVAYLNDNTAGGRARFITDSRTLAVNVELCALGKMPHFALTGSVGFDVYADGRYAGTLIPPFDVTDGFEAKIALDGERHEITVNFPLYSGIKALYIGVEDGADIAPAAPYDEPPVVFYGSSITQGGCASRSGNSYQALLARSMGFDYINLGFSGSACGETAMAEYIASLSMKAFVLDYDYNAPTAEHLRQTHKPLFDAVRASHPDIPIVMMTRPSYYVNEEETERQAIVRETFETAVKSGDRHVYFIDGRELVGKEFAEIATVDGVHPNDCGFYAMATRLERTLRKAFE